MDKTTVLIVCIFVLIFIIYFYVDSTYLKKKYSKKIENFASDINYKEVKDRKIKIFKNIKKINTLRLNILRNLEIVYDLFLTKKFNYLKIISGISFKTNLTNIYSDYKRINKVVDEIINICESFRTDFFKNISILFNKYKVLNINYIKYFNPNFVFNKNLKDDNNLLIIDKRIDIEEQIVTKYDEVKLSINNLENSLQDLSESGDIKELLNEFLKPEKINNKSTRTLIENHGIFTLLKNLKDLQKENHDFVISSDDKQIYTNLIKTKKTLLSKTNINVNSQTDNISNSINKISLSKDVVSGENEEIKFLNSSKTNNDIFVNFCKKMKKINSPNESNLMFKRFNKEFREKKAEQILKLEAKIDDIINNMTESEKDNYNLYMVRTNDQAGKQIEAINKAADNLKNNKKIKVNLS
tara:strand:+ start:478 stop:1713 length:1236 start_codon:yes stop_codon:yes gene_type:complete